MVKRIFLLLNLAASACTHDNDSASQLTQAVQTLKLSYDQIGYPAKGPIYLVVEWAFATPPPMTLTLKPLLGTSPALSVQLVPLQNWEAVNVRKLAASFESPIAPGDYAISIGDTPTSRTLHIGTDGYTKVLRDALRFYFHQRASVAIVDDAIPNRSRPAAHLDQALKLYPVHKGSLKAAAGGWYDAGDYGKYVVNAGITTSTLMSISNLAPNHLGDSLGIPESSNTKSDLLDEVQFELNWLKSMQDEKDGGVYSKVAGLYWPGMVAPDKDVQDRYLFPKATNATLNFAAVMAQASRIFAPIDADYAKDCLARAAKAMAWAIKHTDEKTPLVKDGSGNYDGGSYDDEYFWALTELYLSTGKRQYLDYLTGKKKIAGYPDLQNLLVKPDIHGPADWGMGQPPTTGVVNLAYFSILMYPQSAAPIDVSSVKAALMRFADLVIGQIGSNPYRVPLDRTEFVWGSNAIAANKAVILAYAYHMTGDAKYLDGIYEVLHYVFGRNALAISMVTGHGFSYPRNPHHRISASRADQTPTPGMLVGGPNQRKEDRLDYGSCLPERCYLDESASFASNEVAINWNAPLALILAIVLNDQPPLKN